MEATTALAELEALAKKLEVEVVYDHLTGEGAGSGGLCKIKGRWRVIIERRSSVGERLSILAKALSRFDLESHYLTPSLRELVERYVPADRRPRPAAPPEEPAAEAQLQTAAQLQPEPQPQPELQPPPEVQPQPAAGPLAEEGAADGEAHKE